MREEIWRYSDMSVNHNGLLQVGKPLSYIAADALALRDGYRRTHLNY